MTSTISRPATGRELVSDDLFDSLVSQIVAADGMYRGDAEHLMDQALAFLYTCAKNPNAQLRPSKAIDLGWHTFILNTREYAEFCERVAGRFMHHAPETFEQPVLARDMLAPTVVAMRKAGFDVDRELWAQTAAACTQCHGGCTDCGQGDGKGGK